MTKKKRYCLDCKDELPPKKPGRGRAQVYCRACAKERKREQQRKRYARPEIKEHKREYDLGHRQRPEVKERKRESERKRRARPEYKERKLKYDAEYRTRPGAKERMREYNAEYQYEYRHRPGAKERARKRRRELRSVIRVTDLIREPLGGDWVYVLRAVDDNDALVVGAPVKIGESKRLLQRLRSLQGGNGFSKLRLDVLIPAKADVEQTLHDLLDEYRIAREGRGREMFRPAPEVLRVVGILTEAFPHPRPGLTKPQVLLDPAEILALLEEPVEFDREAGGVDCKGRC